MSGEIPLEWSTVDIIGVEISTLGVQNTQFLIANNRESASIANFQPIKLHVTNQLQKMWHRRQNLFEFCIFLVILVWIHPNDGTTLLTMEQLFQQTFCPVYTWPWINPVLKKWKKENNFLEPS